MIKIYEKGLACIFGICGQIEVEIELTNRWKIEIKGDEKTLFLEKKNESSTEWIHENNIIVRNEETYINNCST